MVSLLEPMGANTVKEPDAKFKPLNSGGLVLVHLAETTCPKRGAVDLSSGECTRKTVSFALFWGRVRVELVLFWKSGSRKMVGITANAKLTQDGAFS